MQYSFIVLVTVFFLSTTLYASDINTTTMQADTNSSQDINRSQPTPEQLLQIQRLKEKKEALAREVQRKNEIQVYTTRLNKLEQKISSQNTWIKSYASYLTSLEVRTSLKKIKKRIEYLSNNTETISARDELSALISKQNILTSQIDKLKGKSDAPFSSLITPPEIPNIDKISNPFDVFTGFSTIKTLNANLDEYKLKYNTLVNIVALLRKENDIYLQLITLDKEKNFEKVSQTKQVQLERFETALDTMKVTLDVYQKRIEIVQININKGIEKQTYRLMKIGTAVFIVFLIFFLLKLVVKKYITDNERFYMANKIITFANFTVILLILFFNYIENASYLITILGFASAGIAIAMKDWFMSILGWLVIVFGGSIHVGDRIRVDMDGMQYVGDVMDISLLRMTLFEDVTLTTYMDNRRAGRIIFVPNNYIFTRMIANYSHSSLKTVWDGIDITITFDSNHKKAMHICKEISKKYSKGYTDITRKQLNKIRNHYSLKNTNVEPRIFSCIEPNGIVVSTWYLTNTYATLTLRSVISTEIVDGFNKEDDITIAYPTQKLHIQEQTPKQPPLNEGEIV